MLSPSLKGTHWEFILMILMTAQFPMYAVLLAYTKGSRRIVVAMIILLVHTVVAVIALHLYESAKPGYGVLLPPVAIQQSLAADGAIACFSSSFFP
jgi:hypothetical protein